MGDMAISVHVQKLIVIDFIVNAIDQDYIAQIVIVKIVKISLLKIVHPIGILLLYKINLKLN